MKEINKLLQSIEKAKSIAILSHVGPDGDTLGSMMAMKEIIDQFEFDQKIDTVIIGEIPDLYQFLPKINEAKKPDNSTLYTSYDLVICVDIAASDRLSESRELFKNAKQTANIDHHISNNGYADINIIDTKAAATGEIIFNIAKAFKSKITQSIAKCIYTAILTDTGGFKFENTTPNTFKIAAELLEAGIDHNKIYKECYESKPLPMVKIQAWAVTNASFINEGKLAYTTISKKNMADFDAKDDHIDGIAESLRQVNTVKVAMVLKETKRGDTKISFRSNCIDVCEIAKFFGGGGHKSASGCTIQKNIDDSLNELLPIVKKEISKKLI